MLVDALLLVDEMRGPVDELHQRGQIVGPVVQRVARVLGLLEVHDARRPVGLGVDGFADDHLGQELLGFPRAQVQQLGHARETDSRVVLGHDADVVLDYAIPL